MDWSRFNSGSSHHISVLQWFLGLIRVFASASSFLEVHFLKAFRPSSYASHSAQLISCLFNLKRIWARQHKALNTELYQKYTDTHGLLLLSALCWLFVLSRVLSPCKWVESDELCCGGAPPSHPTISLSACTNMMESCMSPTGKSAMKGAETESWRTCTRSTQLQSVQIKQTHADTLTITSAWRKWKCFVPFFLLILSWASCLLSLCTCILSNLLKIIIINGW